MQRNKRRYRTVYTPRRRHIPAVLKVTVGIIIAAALIFVGYSALVPIGKLLSGNWQMPVKASTTPTRAALQVQARIHPQCQSRLLFRQKSGAFICLKAIYRT